MADGSRIAYPTPAILDSIICSGEIDWPLALSEFIDNSFGVAAGDADSVEITINKNSIEIWDDGNGIADVFQCFALGESGSRLSDIDLGKFGIGAKTASVWIGEIQRVETIRDGKRLSQRVDWGRVRRTLTWPTVDPTISIPAPEEVGTKIIIEKFWNDKPTIRVPRLIKELGQSFAPGIRSGKSIQIVDNRKKPAEIHNVEPWEPPHLECVFEFSGHVGFPKKTYSAKLGLLNQSIGDSGGIRFCFGHRVIEKKMILDGESLPARIFGSVELSHYWKQHLSAHKNKLLDIDDLEREIYERAKAEGIFDLAVEKQRSILLDKISSQIADALGQIKFDQNGSLTADRKPRQVKPPSPPGPVIPNLQPPVVEDPSGSERATKDERCPPGFILNWRKWGTPDEIGYVEFVDNKLAVTLNLLCPTVIASVKEMELRNSSTVNAGVLSIIGAVLMQHADRVGHEWVRDVLSLKERPDKKETPSEMVARYWFDKAARQILAVDD